MARFDLGCRPATVHSVGDKLPCDKRAVCAGGPGIVALLVGATIIAVTGTAVALQLKPRTMEPLADGYLSCSPTQSWEPSEQSS